MTLLVAGGNIIHKIPSFRDDFTDIKYELLDEVCKGYIGRNNVLIDKEDNGYIDIHNEFGEEIYIKSGKKYHYFMLDRNYTIYWCDECGKKFFDHMDIYWRLTKRKEEIEILGDKCADCYDNFIFNKRSKNGKKAIKTMLENNVVPASKQQKYLCNLLQGKLNVYIENYIVDILLENNIVIEYDGSGHWLATSFNENITVEDVDKNDKKRDQRLIDLGYKIIRIVSKKDLLPNDDEIVKLINNCKNKLLHKDEIKIDINELYKNYQLRKIEKADI